MASPPRPSPRREASKASAMDNDPPTTAAFSPEGASHSPAVTGTQRATILVQQKSPLLVATPPQITRALAYSHPFIVPLNHLVGLLSWTTGDPWESFLLVAAFWATCLYGDMIVRFAAPLVLVMGLILAMYVRRFSQLSSTGWTGEKKKVHIRKESEINVSQHKSLEDIVETLRLFTSRCNILLDPFLRITEFLSTQTTATAATTKPALTAMFLRIVLVTPVWILLSISPIQVITTKRVVLAIGTTILTWHSQPARVTRTLFWRSKTCRNICTIVTGLDLEGPPRQVAPVDAKPSNKAKSKTPHEIAASLAAKSGRDAGIRLTFTLYENQRRWLGIGWTSSMLAYERAAWTDEHLNNAGSREKFRLPDVEGGHAKWEWAPGSEWHVVDTDGDTVPNPDGPTSDGGWIYYDNKWQNGRKGKDGWGRYTRRRKWCRDAELVEPDKDSTPEPSLPYRREEFGSTTTTLIDRHQDDPPSVDTATTTAKESGDAANPSRRKKGWLSRRGSQPTSEKSTAVSSGSIHSTVRDDDDDLLPLNVREADRRSLWGVGDEAQMGLG